MNAINRINLPEAELNAAHQAYRDHRTWNGRANKLVRALRGARCALTRDYLQRGLALAEDHVARLTLMTRIEPPAEPARPVNLNGYGMANAPTGYRSATGGREW